MMTSIDKNKAIAVAFIVIAATVTPIAIFLSIQGKGSDDIPPVYGNAPEAPVLSGFINDNSMQLVWNFDRNVFVYHVYHSITEDIDLEDDFVMSVYDAISIKLPVDELAAGTNFYMIIASNASGETRSNVFSFTRFAPTVPPVLLSVEMDHVETYAGNELHYIKLTYEVKPGASQMRVYMNNNIVYLFSGAYYTVSNDIEGGTLTTIVIFQMAGITTLNIGLVSIVNINYQGGTQFLSGHSNSLVYVKA